MKKNSYEQFTNLLSMLGSKTVKKFNHASKLIVQKKNQEKEYFIISTFVQGLSEDLWVPFTKIYYHFM